MRLIVAGGRDFKDISMIEHALDHLTGNYPIHMIITGGCTGVDTIAHKWAIKNGIQTCEMPANWGWHGKKAGPLRNRLMAEIGTHLMVFNGGRGTASMVYYAELDGLDIIDYRTQKTKY